MQTREMPIKINTTRNYNGDYRRIFPLLVEVFQRYIDGKRYGGREIYSEGNLPSEAGKEERRNRTYYNKSRSLNIEIDFQREEREKGERSTGRLTGFVRISGRDLKAVRKLRRLVYLTLG